jgi:sugar/nucleoside kinase (ribokinase family)
MGKPREGENGLDSSTWRRNASVFAKEPRMAGTQFDILMVGHFSNDLLVVDGAAEEAPGGAVYYGSLALRRLGISVAVMTRLHPKDFPRLEALREEGVAVFAEPAPETSGIENYYTSTDMERRICKPRGFAGPFAIQHIPAVRTRVNLVVPVIAGEIDLAFLQAMAVRGPVGMDVQGFVRVATGADLVFRQWPAMREGLSCVTYLKADHAEAELLTGERKLENAAKALAAYGPREILLTQSAGVTVYADGKLHQAPFTSRNLTGRTGRGDTCFATYIGKRLTADPEDACRWAAAVTSLKQERPGPWRGSPADVESRLSPRTA